MRRVYVAAPLPLIDVARDVARTLLLARHHVTSTWHVGSPTVESELLDTETANRATAETCLRDVLHSDALVLLYGPETTRHGSILEVGYALGLGLDVIAVPVGQAAALPTILLRHRAVHHSTLSDICEALRDTTQH